MADRRGIRGRATALDIEEITQLKDELRAYEAYADVEFHTFGAPSSINRAQPPKLPRIDAKASGLSKVPVAPDRTGPIKMDPSFLKRPA